MKKIQIGVHSHTTFKKKKQQTKTSKWFKELTLRPESINPERKHSQYSLWHVLAIAFGLMFSGPGNKSKNRQMGPHQM